MQQEVVDGPQPRKRLYLRLRGQTSWNVPKCDKWDRTFDSSSEVILGHKIYFWELVVIDSRNERLLLKKLQKKREKPIEAVPTHWSGRDCRYQIIFAQGKKYQIMEILLKNLGEILDIFYKFKFTLLILWKITIFYQ